MIIIQLTDMPSEMTSSLSVLHNQLNTNESNKLSTLVCSEDTHHYACLMGTKLLIKFVVHTKFLSIKTIKYQLSTFTTLAVHAHARPTKIKQVSNSLQKTSVNSYSASCSCLSLKYFNRHLRHNTELLPNTDSQLYVSANNSFLDVGIAKISLILGTKTTNVKFLVMKDLSQDAILGSEFLSSTSAVINFDLNTISLFGGTVVLPLVASLDDNRVVRTLKRVRIRAHCEAIIPVKLPDIKQSPAITESLPNLRNKRLGVAAVLVDRKCKNTMIRVINVSESPIFLKEHKASSSRTVTYAYWPSVADW